jgi:uncharacterized protein (DUF58 family)
LGPSGRVFKLPLVVAATAFATCYSFGTVYLLAFDLALPTALGGATVVFALAVVAAYHRLVWTHRPAYREEVPVGVRFQRVVLAAAVGVGLLALCSLPFFAR